MINKSFISDNSPYGYIKKIYIYKTHISARIRRVRIAVCDAFLPNCESIFKMVRSMRIIL